MFTGCERRRGLILLASKIEEVGRRGVGPGLGESMCSRITGWPNIAGHGLFGRGNRGGGRQW